MRALPAPDEVSAHNFANTTETRTVTCYPWAESSCGASGKCILDTTGCSSSGGGCGARSQKQPLTYECLMGRERGRERERERERKDRGGVLFLCQTWLS